MRILLLGFGLSACVDYEVHEVRADSNWFDRTSERLRAGRDTVEDDEESDSEESAEPDALEEPEGGTPNEEDTGGFGWRDEWNDEDGAGGEGDAPSDPDAGSSPGRARAPWTGEVVITELMIDPIMVHDAMGEWVEIRNLSGDWITLAGHVLADRGVDGTAIEPTGAGSLVAAPGGFLVICAESRYFDNGGVECDGTVFYRTLGDGFALSNTEDEVLLVDADGFLLDEFSWNEGFARAGSSLGLGRNHMSESGNDNAANWCPQWSYLPFGDAGTPGEENDACW